MSDKPSEPNLAHALATAHSEIRFAISVCGGAYPGEPSRYADADTLLDAASRLVAAATASSEGDWKLAAHRTRRVILALECLLSRGFADEPPGPPGSSGV